MSFLYPLGDNPDRVSIYTKYIHCRQTDGIDLTNGLKSDDIEKKNQRV